MESDEEGGADEGFVEDLEDAAVEQEDGDVEASREVGDEGRHLRHLLRVDVPESRRVDIVQVGIEHRDGFKIKNLMHQL